jgi:hypothetical protein
MNTSEAVFDFVCPSCGENVLSRRELAGAKMMCPACREIIIVPEPESFVSKAAEEVTKAVIRTSDEIAEGVSKGAGESGCRGCILGGLVILGVLWVLSWLLGLLGF